MFTSFQSHHSTNSLEKLFSELNIGYLDDLTVGGPIDTVYTDIRLIRTEAEHLGLALNVSKFEVITSHHIDLSSHMTGFLQVDIRDASLLGSQLLADRCLDKMLDGKCKELELMMSRVQQLNFHYALTIVRNSMGVPKLMHMLRTSRCIENPRLSQFDNIMKSGLESILNVELSVNQWKQACLPIRGGGLGIRTATSLAPSAFLSSAVSSFDLQQKSCPCLHAFQTLTSLTI